MDKLTPTSQPTLQGSCSLNTERAMTEPQMKIKSAVIFPSCPSLLPVLHAIVNKIIMQMKAIIWCVFYSISMLWDKLPQFVYKLCHQVVPVRDNGFCFLQAVCLTVCMDHDEDMTLGKLQTVYWSTWKPMLTTTKNSIQGMYWKMWKHTSNLVHIATVLLI